MASKNLDDKVDQMEAAVQQYASADTVISIGGYSFTPARLMIAGGIVSTILGGLYGAFEIYKDYQDMKAAISEYVAPDLSAINERLSVIEKEMEATRKSVTEGVDYTNEIKNDLKADIRRVERVVENVERSTKEQQRQVDADLKTARNEMRDLQKEVDRGIKDVKTDMDKKLKEALDNPLAEK